MNIKKQQQQHYKVSFQFSAINEDNLIKLEMICADKNVNYINDMHYSPKASHLIVQYPDCSEKTLCFIASGKWIVRQKYLIDSISAGEWLNESNYHLITKYPKSKLAQASLKWKNSIEKDKIWPFKDWSVLAILRNEKLQKALGGLIEAGHGNVRYIYTKEDLKRIDSSIKLVIYEPDSEFIARFVWKHYKLPCYPYKCIPDYLIQGVYSPTPSFPISFYSNVKINNDCSLLNRDNSSQINYQSIINTFFFPFYNSYAKLYHGKNKHNSTIIDFEIARLILPMWDNACYIEAIDMLKVFKPNENLPVRIINNMYKFIYCNKSFPNQVFLANNNDKMTMKYVYNKIYSYLYQCLINNPPKTKEMKNYYKKIYEEIPIEMHSSCKDSSNIHELVDLLYLMSIHDYLLFKETSILPRECSLVYCRVNHDLCIKILKKLTKNTTTEVDHVSIRKMFQIISFKNKFLGPIEEYENLFKAIKDYLLVSNSQEQINFKNLIANIE